MGETNNMAMEDVVRVRGFTDQDTGQFSTMKPYRHSVR